MLQYRQYEITIRILGGYWLENFPTNGKFISYFTALGIIVLMVKHVVLVHRGILNHQKESHP